jgi:dihydrofolate synthase/folylpolyglutamate synthase
MTYTEAVAHLFSLGPELPPAATLPDGQKAPRRKFDLAHMRMLCHALGDPQSLVPAVLIAGTNGKGSTAATLASILTAAGYRTGLYTSPHLVRVNERIQLSHPTLPSEYGTSSVHAADGPLTLTQIADEDFARLYAEVNRTCEELVAEGALPFTPSFFERVTAIAFLYFAGSRDSENPTPRAEIMVLEVGLGGRLDATNIVEPLVSVITDIALDHQEWLGDTIPEIAAEKCGILRQRGTMVTLPQHPEANTAIGVAATALEVHAINAAEYIPPAQRNAGAFSQGAGGFSPTNPASKREGALAPEDVPLPRNRYTLTVDNEPLEVDSPLPGHHQQRNLALAIATAIAIRNQNGYKITNAAISEGIRNTTWPGRLEFLPPNLLLDVAHNPAGAWTLRGAISALPAGQPRTLIFSCLRDKSLTEMSRILFPLFDSSADGDPERRHDHILLAPIASPRAASVDDLLAAAHALSIPAHAAPHLAGALAQARQITPPGGLILATGSVYLVGEIRHLALEAHA